MTHFQALACRVAAFLWNAATCYRDINLHDLANMSSNSNSDQIMYPCGDKGHFCLIDQNEKVCVFSQCFQYDLMCLATLFYIYYQLFDESASSCTNINPTG